MWGMSPWAAYACAPWRLVPDLLGLAVGEVVDWIGTPPRWFLPFVLGAALGATTVLVLT